MRSRGIPGFLNTASKMIEPSNEVQVRRRMAKFDVHMHSKGLRCFVVWFDCLFPGVQFQCMEFCVCVEFIPAMSFFFFFFFFFFFLISIGHLGQNL